MQKNGEPGRVGWEEGVGGRSEVVRGEGGDGDEALYGCCRGLCET